MNVQNRTAASSGEPARATVGVRPASAGDRREVARLLSHAFLDDPQLSWLLQRYQDRQQRLERLFGIQFRDCLSFGVIDVAMVEENPVGAALWMKPGQRFPPLRRQLATLPRYWRVFGRNLRLATGVLREVAGVHPKEPHWYLAVLGVHPTWQGTGVGASLLRSGLGRADADGAPAFLETSAKSNEEIYSHFGFEVHGHVAFGFDCPPSTTMWRPSRGR
ncbi:MAG: GNAT family N-acetyltransferase [Mycobacteriales bacterium]